jgi:hypothetical protein
LIRPLFIIYIFNCSYQTQISHNEERRKDTLLSNNWCSGTSGLETNAYVANVFHWPWRLLVRAIIVGSLDDVRPMLAIHSDYQWILSIAIKDRERAMVNRYGNWTSTIGATTIQLNSDF